MEQINELKQDTKVKKIGGELKTIELFDLCKEAASEGIVLLKNESQTLPLEKKDKVAIFGRCAINWFYIGYGSGGDVKYPRCPTFKECLIDNQVNFDETLFRFYEEWVNNEGKLNEIYPWGAWPRFYEEMPLNENLVQEAGNKNNKAVVIIGRAAGEDRENILEEGSFYLTNQEKDNLELINKYFKNIIVILDCGNIVDLKWTKDYENIKSIVYAWQGGMESCNALVDILIGKVNPSGHLTDTIAMDYKDHPSSNCFGQEEYNEYREDIYVGYRYFETFSKDRVLYPFGYGLSYTNFSLDGTANFNGLKVDLTLKIKNLGNFKGKEVAQIYLKAPQGKLGKPEKILVNFYKTKLLAPQEEENVNLSFDLTDFASFDDCGKVSLNSYVLEQGTYEIYLGENVRDNHLIAKVDLDLHIICTLDNIMPLKEENCFERIVNNQGQIVYEKIPCKKVNLKERIINNLPKSIPQTGLNIKLQDVKDGKYTLDQFVGQLSNRELDLISQGEGFMDSSLGMSGNAGAFGGVCKSLRDKGVKPIITNDGPSGLRFNGTTALLPCGTCLSSSFNPDLVYHLYCGVAKEMDYYGSDVLLAPGMNIHRNPLCGRNFEYYSEDPYLTGVIASSAVKGIQSLNKAACPKHFACNNQEENRGYNDSRVSQRALREIYFKGFEYVVKHASPKVIMTSYNKINGIFSYYNYDLVTTVLRKEWGYTNLVITDWWMKEDVSPDFKNIANNAYRARAQVDVLMPGELKHKINVGKGYTIRRSLALEDGITLGELQRNAKNILNFILNSNYLE